MTHIAWDRGTINAVLQQVFGDVMAPQQTSKTLCGKRVRMAQIDNQAATCPACLEEAALREAEAQVLREELS